MLKIYAAILMFAVTATSASAVVTKFSVNSYEPAVVPGYVTNDILISFTSQLTGIQMLAQGLNAGDVYQSEYGNDTPVDSAFYGFIPAIEFDSFVGIGGSSAQTTEPILVVGGAVNIGGEAAKTFTTDGIDITWAPAAGVVVANQSDYFVARITLADTANGTLRLLGADTDGGPYRTETWQIVDGHIVPEPATLGLLGLGGVAMLRRRR